jgi:hypothetical protein
VSDTADTADASVFNPLDPAFVQDPFPTLRALRETDPVLPLPGLGFLVTGHQPAAEMLRRRDGDTRWVEFQQRRMGPGVEHEPYCRGNVNSLLMISGEQHQRVRGTFQRNFSSRLMELLRDPVTETAHRLIDAFAERGEAELMSEFASELPMWAISQLLKVPHEDEQLMLGWMEGFLLSVQLLPLTPEQLAKANDAVSSLDAYFIELIAKRRLEPLEDDLLSLLIAEADAGRLTGDELVTNAWTLFVGGHDTTARTICNAVATFDAHADQLARLVADPSLWPNAVEEVLRYVGPVQGTHRLLREEVTLGGHTVPPDTPVIMYLSGANHDESWCPRAAEFDTSRDVPADHLAFGAGPHKCPGAHMARMMVQVALQALYTRLPGLRVREVVWDTEVMNFRGPATLHVSWDVERRRAPAGTPVSGRH